jgi:hypothetical protein
MPVPWWATFLTVITGYPGAEGAWVQGLQPAGATS